MSPIAEMDFDLVPGGTGRNYTGILTKTIVYTGTLFLFLIGAFCRVCCSRCCLDMRHCNSPKLTGVSSLHSYCAHCRIHRHPKMGQLSQ